MLDIMGSPAAEDWIYRVTNDYRDTEAVVKQWLDKNPNEGRRSITLSVYLRVSSRFQSCRY